MLRLRRVAQLLPCGRIGDGPLASDLGVGSLASFCPPVVHSLEYDCETFVKGLDVVGIPVVRVVSIPLR